MVHCLPYLIGSLSKLVGEWERNIRRYHFEQIFVSRLGRNWLILPSLGKSSEVRDLTSQLLLDRQGRNLTPILDADSFDRLVHRTLAHFDKPAERNGAKLTYEIL